VNQGRLGLLLHQTLIMRVAPTTSGAKAPYAIPIAAGVFLSMVLPPVLRI
jgi:hypothetical protein